MITTVTSGRQLFPQKSLEAWGNNWSRHHLYSFLKQGWSFWNSPWESANDKNGRLQSSTSSSFVAHTRCWAKVPLSVCECARCKAQRHRSMGSVGSWDGRGKQVLNASLRRAEIPQSLRHPQGLVLFLVRAWKERCTRCGQELSCGFWQSASLKMELGQVPRG